MSKRVRWLLALLSLRCYCGDPLYCVGICPRHPEFGDDLG